MGFFRAALLGFVLLTVVYVLVSVYSRSLRREALEKEWDSAAHPGVGDGARDAYIEVGMKTYHQSLRRKLILLVYVVPVIAVGVITYLVNHQ